MAWSAALLPMLSSAITEQLPMTMPSSASSERRPRLRRLPMASCSNWPREGEANPVWALMPATPR